MTASCSTNRAAIIRLLSLCSPSAIGVFIISIIIDTVNCMGEARAWAHVIQERLKGTYPLFTDGDCSSVIVFPLRITTPTFHGYPTFVCWAWRSFWAMPMNAEPFIVTLKKHFAKQAPTTTNSTTAKMRATYDCEATTTASAKPMRFTMANLSESNNRQSTKELTDSELFKLPLVCH